MLQVFTPVPGNTHRPLNEALEFLTDEAINKDQYTRRTIKDLRDACKVLTHRNAEIERLAERVARALIHEGVRTKPAVELLAYLDSTSQQSNIPNSTVDET